MIKNRELNMCEGAILPKLIKYCIPLLLTNVIQVLFHSADVLMLGMLIPGDKGVDAVAAVGNTSSLINLIIGLFTGLSVGANVLVAKSMGRKNTIATQKYVGMSILISLLGGVLLLCVGVLGARTFLTLMDCPVAILDLAVTYLTIYFLGLPIILLYNYCASILRAAGDTLRPLIFLIIGGVLNVGGNYIFITQFNMTVEGVALSTIISQAFSAILCLIVLTKTDGVCKLRLKYFRIFKNELKELLKVGIPSGVQSMCFSISNVLIMSSINSYGKIAAAGSAVGAQFTDVVFTALNAIPLSVVAFVSQNYGAGKIERIKQIKKESFLLVTVLGLILGLITFIFAEPLCRIATDSQEVINYAKTRITYIALPYFICGIEEIDGQTTRGMGKSTLSMIISLIGICGFRVVWIALYRYIWDSYDMIWLSYVVSWALTIVAYEILHIKLFKNANKQIEKEMLKEETLYGGEK